MEGGESDSAPGLLQAGQAEANRETHLLLLLLLLRWAENTWVLLLQELAGLGTRVATADTSSVWEQVLEKLAASDCFAGAAQPKKHWNIHM